MASPKATAAKNVATIPAPADIDPDMPEGADEVDDGDVDELLTLAVGDSVTGEYRGSKQTRSGQVGKMSTLHKVRLAGGKTVGVWGSYQLDQKLAKLEHGAIVWIKYVGKDAIGNGNTMHKYRVARVNNDLPF